MKPRFWLAAAIVLLVCLLWLAMPSARSTRGVHLRPEAIEHERDAGGSGNAPGSIKTKARDRMEAGRHTHRVERLREFMLPAIRIERLTLEESLRKLMGSYEDACRKCGESPLPLTFAVPPGDARRLDLHLPPGDFRTAVRLLAALSGTTVSRRDHHYVFHPMPDERNAVSRQIGVPPGFRDALNELAGLAPPRAANPFTRSESNVRESVEECLDRLLGLDSSTHVSLGASGELKLETTSNRDASVISGLAGILGGAPMQVKCESRILEIPAGTDWNPPDGSHMTDHEMATLLRETALQSETDLKFLPSITGRNGQSAKMEMIREIIHPSDGPNGGFETREVGQVLDIQGNLLGFGHDADLRFTDTALANVPSSGRPVFDTRTDLSDRSYTDDGATKFMMQTRKDGSRAVLLVRLQAIDATGRPIR